MRRPETRAKQGVDPASREKTDALAKRLAAYAVAAGAAGVGMLALAQPAHADIIFTPADRIFDNESPPLFLDLNHDGITDFQVQGATTHYGSPALLVAGRGHDEILTSIYGGPAALPAGYKVGPSAGFADEGTLAVLYYSLCFGPFCFVSHRYLGLVFSLNGAAHFGWAEISLGVSGGRSSDIVARLEGYAYNTVANQPILTGQKGPKQDLPGSSTPEPGTLGLLALGSLGLGFWRRKKSVATKMQFIRKHTV